MDRDRGRKAYVIKNLSYGFIMQVIVLLSNIFIRWLFIRTFAAEYLGVTTLLSNIIGVLSLTELGFTTAMLYSLYKPLSDKDYDKVNAVLQYFKKIYKIIALIILVLGLLLLPFLHLMVNLEYDVEDIYLYYLVYLSSSVCSYFFVYKRFLIQAVQKEYIVKTISSIVSIVKLLLECIAIIAFRNYLFYLIVNLFSLVLINVICVFWTNKRILFLDKTSIPLDEGSKMEIKRNVKSLFIYRISGVIVNNSDYIIISTLVGTLFVGYYSNYQVALTALLGFVQMIYTAFVASLGDFNSRNDKSSVEVFYRIEFVFYIVYGVFCITTYTVFDDFILLLTSNNYEYLLPNTVVLCIIANFLFAGMQHVITLFRDTLGMFKEMQYYTVIFFVLNIVLSIFLGIWLGMFGVLLATIISRVFTVFVFEPIVLFRKFQVSPFRFFVIDTLQILVILVMCVAFRNLFDFTIFDYALLDFIVKGVIVSFSSFICIILTALLMKREFKYYLSQIKSIIFARKREENKE